MTLTSAGAGHIVVDAGAKVEKSSHGDLWMLSWGGGEEFGQKPGS
jgi:hypothetical protein